MSTSSGFGNSYHQKVFCAQSGTTVECDFTKPTWAIHLNGYDIMTSTIGEDQIRLALKLGFYGWACDSRRCPSKGGTLWGIPATGSAGQVQFLLPIDRYAGVTALALPRAALRPQALVQAARAGLDPSVADRESAGWAPWYSEGPIGYRITAISKGEAESGRFWTVAHTSRQDEHLQLNEDTVWQGARTDKLNPKGHEGFLKVRSLLLESKAIDGSEDLGGGAYCCKTMIPTPRRMPGYSTLGDLYLRSGSDGEATDYRRELDLTSGLRPSLTHWAECITGGKSLLRRQIKSCTASDGRQARQPYLRSHDGSSV